MLVLAAVRNSCEAVVSVYRTLVNALLKLTLMLLLTTQSVPELSLPSPGQSLSTTSPPFSPRQPSWLGQRGWR